MSGDNGNGKPPEQQGPKVVDTVTLMEIRVHRLENGQERTEVIAHEMMMVQHKKYTLHKLVEALSRINMGWIKFRKGKEIIKPEHPTEVKSKSRHYMIDKLLIAMRVVMNAGNRKKEPTLYSGEISNGKLHELWNNLKRKKHLNKGGAFGGRK